MLDMPVEQEIFTLKGRLFTLTVLTLHGVDIDKIAGQCEYLIKKAPKLFEYAPIVISLAHLPTSNIDFATINVSSPNTEKLRDLQGKAALRQIIEQVDAVRLIEAHPVALFLKIAPDLSDAELADIAEVAMSTGCLQGIIEFLIRHGH